MTLTWPLLFSLFHRVRAQLERSRQKVNVHCRRAIYRPIYLLLMDEQSERESRGCRSENVDV